jgi:hypothetical protein
MLAALYPGVTTDAAGASSVLESTLYPGLPLICVTTRGARRGLDFSAGSLQRRHHGHAPSATQPRITCPHARACDVRALTPHDVRALTTWARLDFWRGHTHSLRRLPTARTTRAIPQDNAHKRLTRHAELNWRGTGHTGQALARSKSSSLRIGFSKHGAGGGSKHAAGTVR